MSILSNLPPLSYSYYPGCSAHATGREYDASLRAVCAALEIELQELPGWNCCGASSAHSLSHNLSVGLAARNLALIETDGRTAIAPCAACYNRLRVAQADLAADPAQYSWLNDVLNAPLQGTAQVRSLISVMIDDIGLEQIAGRVRRPLSGLRTVSYYGCLLARPVGISELGDPEHPHELDRLMSTLGAEPMPWSHAVDCCGGSLSIARPDLVRRMTGSVTAAARAARADLIITACPLCQVNLEMRQPGPAGEAIPALYFTEAMGLAFDLPNTADWLRRHLVDPRPVLETHGVAP